MVKWWMAAMLAAMPATALAQAIQSIPLPPSAVYEPVPAPSPPLDDTITLAGEPAPLSAVSAPPTSAELAAAQVAAAEARQVSNANDVAAAGAAAETLRIRAMNDRYAMQMKARDAEIAEADAEARENQARYDAAMAAWRAQAAACQAGDRTQCAAPTTPY